LTSLSEDRVYARHRRRGGAVLIVGTGAVGGFLAEELARLGISPIRLVDRDVLEVENLVRHPLGAADLGRPKAPALADQIRQELPDVCEATGTYADFLELSWDEQLRLAREADVVIAATDSVACQRRINEVCLAAEVTAVYPAVWVGAGVRDAEVGEILWVLPGRHTPCYLCATGWRPEGADAEARGGTRADIQVLVAATVWVVAGLLEPRDERARILDHERTLILVHGFMPTSEAVQDLFDGSDLRSVRVPFPSTRCPACGGQQLPGRQPPRPIPPSLPPQPTPDPQPAFWAPIVAAATVGILVLVGIVTLVVSLNPGVRATLPSIPNSVPSAEPSTTQATLQDPSLDREVTSFAITMQDMTTACQQQYNDPSATATVTPTGSEPPAWWIKCYNTAAVNMGGLSLTEFCSQSHPGTRDENPNLNDSEAWKKWRCSSA